MVAAAFALSTLSFAAGVAGDLSLSDRTSGTRVVLRIPPELPPDAIRAAPLPPLVTSPAAEASPAPPQQRSQTIRIAPKPVREFADAGPKIDPDRAPKPEELLTA